MNSWIIVRSSRQYFGKKKSFSGVRKKDGSIYYTDLLLIIRQTFCCLSRITLIPTRVECGANKNRSKGEITFSLHNMAYKRGIPLYLCLRQCCSFDIKEGNLNSTINFTGLKNNPFYKITPSSRPLTSQEYDCVFVLFN